MRLARRGSLGDLSKRLDRARDDLAGAEEALAAAARERQEKLAEVAAADLDADEYGRQRQAIIERERLAVDRRDGAAERVSALEAICADLAVEEARTHVRSQEALLGPLVAEEGQLRDRLEAISVEKAKIEAAISDAEDALRHASAPFDPTVEAQRRRVESDRRERCEWIARRPESMWPSLLDGEPPLFRRMVEEARAKLDGEQAKRQAEIAEAAALSRALHRVEDVPDPNAIKPGEGYERIRVA